MRPHQWVKNSFVLAPVVFAQDLTNPEQLARAVLAAGLFSLASSAVYLLNDIVDVEKDRAHPTKRDRPIASGVLPVPVARRAAAAFATIAVVGGGLLDWRFAVVAFIYLAQNLAYSVKLKNIAYVDVLTIAFGFLLRIVAGAFAIRVPISMYLIMCTFSISLFLAMGKRRHEIIAAAVKGKTRAVLVFYDKEKLTQQMYAVAMATTAAYTAYSMQGSTRTTFGTEYLWLTIPMILVGMLRFMWLTGREDDPHSPTELMIKDPIFIANIMLWGATIIFLIYISPLLGWS